MLEAVLTAAVSVTAIGIICALMLVIAARFISVKEDDKQKNIRELLPGANCGACGFTGCDGYAKALAEGSAATNLCIPGADAVSRAISEELGVAFEDTIEQVATVRCCGDCTNTEKKASYIGIESCRAAKMLYGGEGMCTYGCIGLGDCAAVCPEGAVCMVGGIAHIDARKCQGCGMCASACPNKLIAMMPDVERVVVACSNNEKGAISRGKCKNACIACRKCEKSCPEGAITVTDNLARIDYDKCNGCGICAEQCPVGCIRLADYSGSHRFK